MSVEMNFYVGRYFKLWLPTTTEFWETKSMCRRCNIETHSDYCSDCGTKTTSGKIERQVLFNIYDLCEEISNGNMFHCFDIENDNFRNCSFIINGQPSDNDHVKICDETIEIPIPDKNVDIPDWYELKLALHNENIKYEEMFGILSWFD